MPMDFEPTTDEIEQETMELEMTPVCIDMKKKAKKASARLANIMCRKTSKNYFRFNLKLQTTNFFKSQTRLAA